jgi:hypothetical protein
MSTHVLIVTTLPVVAGDVDDDVLRAAAVEEDRLPVTGSGTTALLARVRRR